MPSFIWDDTEGVYRDLSTGQPLSPDPAFLADWGGLPVWRDEFDSPGIDSAKWNARDNEALSYDEAVVYAANNIIPGDGVLYQRIGAIDPPVMRGGRLRAFSTGLPGHHRYLLAEVRSLGDSLQVAGAR